MVCIYHNKDLDGYCSGAIVKLKYPDAQMIGYDYSEELDIVHLIRKGEPVVMIDVSLPMMQMLWLATWSHNQLTWIDHHKTAINEYMNFIEDSGVDFLEPVLEVGIAACEIAWKHYFPGTEIPKAVELLGMYDTWRNEDKGKWELIIMPFQYGMRNICNSPENFPLYLLTSKVREGTIEIIRQGEQILNYQKMQNTRACKHAFVVNYYGYRVLALNIGGANSTAFDSVYDPNLHDILCPFYFTGTQWVFSLFSLKDIDVSVIAKANGGGGHKQAAGFQKKNLPAEFLTHVKI